MTKAQTDAAAAKESVDAAKRLLDNRQQLFKDGALAKKQVDEAEVSYAQAKAAFDTTQQHLQALQSVGGKEQINTAAAQVEAAKGQLRERAGASRVTPRFAVRLPASSPTARSIPARWLRPARRC